MSGPLPQHPASGHRRGQDQRGATLVEYFLFVALIAMVCISAVTFAGTSGSNGLDPASGNQGSDPYTGWTCLTDADGDTHYFVREHPMGFSPDIAGPCP